MPTEISDWQVELVRTFVSQDVEALKPMLAYMPKRTDPGSNEPDGTSLLLRAMFVEACHRRFAGATRADIIRFVSHARIRRGRNAPKIDPAAAEKLILEAVTGTPAEDLTELQKAQHIILLCELIEDENPTWSRLDEYLTTARTFAEQHATGV